MIGIVFQKPIFQYQLNTLNSVKNKCGGQKKSFEGCRLDHTVIKLYIQNENYFYLFVKLNKILIIKYMLFEQEFTFFIYFKM